jgi:hypothetical protein
VEAAARVDRPAVRDRPHPAAVRRGDLRRDAALRAGGDLLPPRGRGRSDGFAGLSLSAAAAGISLRGRLPGRSGALAATGLLLVGAGTACAGVAREDCSTALDACRALEASGAVSGHHMVHELGALLHISKKTVERHRANILEKLGMRDRVELTRYAIRRGLIQP